MKTQKNGMEQEAQQYIIVGAAAIVTGILLMGGSMYLTHRNSNWFACGGVALAVIGVMLLVCSSRVRLPKKVASHAKVKKGNGKK
jgi:threonine/homoserine/homoserine lactone efflux protein